MSQGAGSAEAAGPEGVEGLPAVDFATFVLSLAHSTLVHLGDAPDPATGQSAPLNLAMARQTVDLIALLADKTRGNLTGEEERLIEQLLYDLRLRYVETRKVETRKVETRKVGDSAPSTQAAKPSKR